MQVERKVPKVMKRDLKKMNDNTQKNRKIGLALKVVAIITALIGAFFSGIFTEKININYQKYKTKRVIYYTLMQDILTESEYAKDKNISKVEAISKDLQNLYFELEPYIDKTTQKSLVNELWDYNDTCQEYATRKRESYYIDELRFKLSQDQIHSSLYKALFGKEPAEEFKIDRGKTPSDFNPAPGITP